MPAGVPRGCYLEGLKVRLRSLNSSSRLRYELQTGGGNEKSERPANTFRGPFFLLKGRDGLLYFFETGVASQKLEHVFQQVDRLLPFGDGVQFDESRFPVVN